MRLRSVPLGAAIFCLVAILAAMQKDKKIEGGRIKFALPQRVGRVDFGIEVEIELVRSVIMQLMG